MGCSHANGLYVTCKAVIMVAPPGQPGVAVCVSITDVGGEVRVAYHTMTCRRGRPASRKVAPEGRRGEFSGEVSPA